MIPVILAVAAMLSADAPADESISVTVVGGEKKIPLKDGHFEVRLPAKLFDGNPEEIKLEWVDLYRN